MAKTALDTIDPLTKAAKEGNAVPYYKYTDNEQEILRDRFDKFQYCVDERQIPRRYFDELSYDEVINESVKRAISYLPPRVDGEWRTRVTMPETENKIQAYLSFAAQQRLRSEVTARFEGKVTDKTLSVILAHLDDYFMDEENFDEKFVDLFYELLVKPLVIVCEEYSFKTRWVNMLTEYNFETGEYDSVPKHIIDEDRPNTRVVLAEHFYFPDFYQPDLQKQRYIFEESEVPYETAEAKYKDHPNWKYVMRKGEYTAQQQKDNLHFFSEWSSRVGENNVQILDYYCRETDTHNVIINGIPMIKLNSPIIYDHKDYPYNWAKAQKYATNFAPGKPLSIKLLKLQDIEDTLINMFLDRTYFSVQPFFFTGFEDEIDINDISPGARINVPDIEKLKEANIQAVKQGDLSMHETIMSAFNRSSMDPVQQGEMANSQTATAIQMARESAIRMFGLTLNFMMWMEQRRKRQRIANILQFYPKHTAIKQATGEFEFKDKESQRENSILSDGNLGIQIVRMVDPKDKKVTQADVTKMQEEYSQQSGQKVELFYLTPSALKDIEFRVRTIPNSSIAQTKSMKQAMFKENSDWVLQRFGQQLGQGGSNVLYEESLDELDLPKEKINLANKEIQAQQEAQSKQSQEMAAMQQMQGRMPGASAGRPGMMNRPGAGQSVSKQLVGNPAAAGRNLEGLPQQ